MTPNTYNNLRKQAEKEGFRKTQNLILAKLTYSQRRKYWFCFTVSKIQEHMILVTILGMIALAFAPAAGLAVLGVTSLFLVWASVYKRAHQDPVTDAIKFYKQVHIETAFLELKKIRLESKKLPRLPQA